MADDGWVTEVRRWYLQRAGKVQGDEVGPPADFGAIGYESADASSLDRPDAPDPRIVGGAE